MNKKEEILNKLDIEEILSLANDTFMEDEEFLSDVDNMTKHEIIGMWLEPEFEDMPLLEFIDMIKIYSDIDISMYESISNVSKTFKRDFNYSVKEQKLYTSINEFKQQLNESNVENTVEDDLYDLINNFSNLSYEYEFKRYDIHMLADRINIEYWTQEGVSDGRHKLNNLIYDYKKRKNIKQPIYLSYEQRDDMPNTNYELVE